MLSRPALAIRARSLVPRASSCAQLVQRRFLASAGSPTASYQTSESSGIKIAARDTHGPITRLSLVVKAGTRYEPLPGLSVGLEEFAFKNTSSRSALRITRESELLGSDLRTTHTREALVLSANFISADLPYFMELLAEVISKTRYTTHELHDDVERSIKHKQARYSSSAAKLALDAAHSTAFHTGLGSPLYPAVGSSARHYCNEHAISDFAASVYQKNNIALVCIGASAEVVSKWTQEFFDELEGKPGELPLNTKASKYHGGEQRISLSGGNAITIAFQGAAITASKPEFAVLTTLLGGQSSIKWTSGSSLLAKSTAGSGATVSTVHLPYTDAGLLAIQISGSTLAVRSAAQEPFKALKAISEGSISAQDVKNAIARARFDALDALESPETSITHAGTGLVHTGKLFQASDLVNGIESVSPEKLKTTAKKLLDSKATVAAVGDLHTLPFAEEIGLRV